MGVVQITCNFFRKEIISHGNEQHCLLFHWFFVKYFILGSLMQTQNSTALGLPAKQNFEFFIYWCSLMKERVWWKCALNKLRKSDVSRCW